MKQPSSATTTPSKQKPTQVPNQQKSTPQTFKQETSSANKPLDKSQLYINSIKESITVSDMKSIYPKAKSVKMQKRKVGPNHKIMQ